jgi:trk system potassium uptake protein TrkA
MKIVIVGAGKVGFQIAKQLVDEKKNVVVIERDPQVAKHVTNYLDCMVINDEGNNIEVLRKAGVGKADFFIAVTDSDEINMISCGIVSSEFENPYKIARVRNLEYSETQISTSPFLGIDHILNPEIEVSKVITRSIEHGAMSDILFFEKTRFQMRNVTATDGSLFMDKTLRDIKKELPADFLVAFLVRGNDYIVPSGDDVIRENDNLYIVASEENLERLIVQTGKWKITPNKVVIVGGGRIGSYVADNLLRRQRQDASFLERITKGFTQKLKRNIILVDRDADRCAALSERFPDALVINEDVSDEGIYEEGNFTRYDLIVTATANQELNIITAVYAKSLGIKRSIAVVNKNNYINIAQALGIDVTVSQKVSMVNSILKLIRRGNIKNIYSFADGMVEVIELAVENSLISGTRIRDIKLPPHTLVVSRTREDENIIPDGSNTVENGDYIVVIARKESVKKIEDIFTGAA